MATLNIDLYDALKEAKVSEEKARAAAAVVAANADAPARFDKVDKRLEKVDSDIGAVKIDVQELRGRVALVQWMIGFNLAATMAMLWKMMK